MTEQKKSIMNKIIGSILMATTCAMYIVPMFYPVKRDFTDVWYVPLIPLTAGMIMYFKPNLFITTSNTIIEKITNKKTQ